MCVVSLALVKLSLRDFHCRNFLYHRFPGYHFYLCFWPLYWWFYNMPLIYCETSPRPFRKKYIMNFKRILDNFYINSITLTIVNFSCFLCFLVYILCVCPLTICSSPSCIPFLLFSCLECSNPFSIQHQSPCY